MNTEAQLIEGMVFHLVNEPITKAHPVSFSELLALMDKRPGATLPGLYPVEGAKCPDGTFIQDNRAAYHKAKLRERYARQRAEEDRAADGRKSDRVTEDGYFKPVMWTPKEKEALRKLMNDGSAPSGRSGRVSPRRSGHEHAHYRS